MLSLSPKWYVDSPETSQLALEGQCQYLLELDQMAPAWSTLSSSTWFEACTQWQFEQVFFFRELIWKEVVTVSQCVLCLLEKVKVTRGAGAGI